MKLSHKILLLVTGSFAFVGLAWAVPAVTESTVNVARSDIRIWNVKTTGAPRQGSSTETKDGQVDVKHSDGTTGTYDAKITETSGTTFQDGEICHNYGPQCYCGTTTYRFETGASKWKFAIPSNNQPVSCPSGIQPTGDAEIKKSMTQEESRQKAMEAREKAAKARGK